MAGKKKKSKPTANSARGFATVSTASKAKVAESKEDDDFAQDSEQSKPNAPTAIPDISEHAQKSKEQAVTELSPEELERQLEENELQLLVEKYGDQVKKDIARNVNRMKTDKRVLRTQSEDLSVRTWLDEVILEDIVSQMQNDSKHESMNLKARPSEGTSDSPNTSPLSDDNLAILWTLQSILRDLGFDHAAVDAALRSVARSSLLQSNVRSHKSTPILLDEALIWLARNAEKSQLPSYAGMTSGMSPSTDAATTLLQSEAASVAQVVNQGNDETELDKQSGAEPTLTANVPHVPAGPGIQNDDSDQDATSATDSDGSLEADDPGAQERYVKLMRKLHEHHPELSEVAAVSKKKTKRSSKNIQTTLSPRVRNIQAKIAALESDILFDLDMARTRWAQERIDLVRDEAQRRKHGINKTQQAEPTSTTEADVKAAASLSDDEDDGVLGLGDLESTLQEAAAPESEVTETGSRTVVRDFGKWTGVSPRKLLEETCRTRDPGAKLSFSTIARHSVSKRQAVKIQWSQPRTSNAVCPITEVSLTSSQQIDEFTMTDISTPDVGQAEAYIAVVALFSVSGAVNRDEKVFMRLPTTWRDLWDELREAHKEQTDTIDREQLRALRELAEVSVNDDHVSGTVAERPVNIPPAPKTRIADSHTETLKMSEHHYPDVYDEPARLRGLWDTASSTAKFVEMQKARSQLPMWAYRQELMDAISKNQVIIISGETGCGKSTQTPSFILENELSQGKKCKIMCTEPRRISALSLARRVSQELGEPRNALDSSKSLVGYAIRLDSKVSSLSRLIYATTGVMMRRLEHDSELKDITHLIIDEVHERTIDSDFLLIVLQRLMPRRPDLKVILMSATVNAERFSDYFNGAPVFSVPGRTFPVNVKYLEDAIEMSKYTHAGQKTGFQQSTQDLDDTVDDDMSPAERSVKSDLSGYSIATVNVLKEYNEYRINYHLIVQLLSHLANSEALSPFSKAILIFLPGLAEIRRMRDTLAGHKLFERDFQVHALHSAIATEEQERVFLVPPRGIRKIVLSTNISETGVTIPDVTCVIDTGTHKEMRYDERRQLSRLTEVFISRANAKQRRGRAGRVQEGICFHLFTKSRHDNLMAPQQTPEMMRLSLQELVLRVKTCNMGGVEETLAAALDPPLPKNVKRAIDSLIDVKALTAAEELTPLGRQLAKLPLDVFLGKLILLGSIFRCLDSALTIAAVLSNKSPFAAPMNAREQADNARLSFKKGDSDLLTVYSAYCTWKRICSTAGISEQEFVRRNYLNLQTLLAIEDTKGQLANALIDSGFLKSDGELKTSLTRLRASRGRNFIQLPKSVTENDTREIIVNAVTAWSFYPKLLARDGNGWRNVANNQNVSLSPTSVNKRSRAGRYLSFYHIMQSMSKAYNAHETSVVEEFAVALLCGDADFKFYAGVITVDSNRLRFSLPDWKSLLALKLLRDNVRAVMNQRFKSPGKELSESQAAWLDIWQRVFQKKTDN